MTRFERFQQRMRLAPNILSKRLRALTDAGILERRLYQETPRAPRVRAHAPRGRELFPVVMALMRWGDAHRSPQGAPAVVRHAGCGGLIDAHATCERCDMAVGSDEVELALRSGLGAPARAAPRPRLGARQALPGRCDASSGASIAAALISGAPSASSRSITATTRGSNWRPSCARTSPIATSKSSGPR